MATTTGFVQRLTLLSGGQAACAWVGGAPNSAETFSVQINPSDNLATINQKQAIISLLSESQLAGRQIDVEHGDSSAEITGVTTHAENVSLTPLQLDAMEVTQAVQDLSHSIPLLAGKRTIVRLYLSQYAAPASTVKGEILIRRSPTDAPVTIVSMNTVVLDPTQAGNLISKRVDAARSLNFVLPPGYTETGPLTVQINTITEVGSSKVLKLGGERRLTVRFHPMPPLRIRVLGFRYTLVKPPLPNKAGTFTPASTDFTLLYSWLTRAYPAGQLVRTSTIVDVATVNDTAKDPFTSDSINAQLAAIRALDMDAGGDRRTHYYGLVSDGGYWMRGAATNVPQTPRPDTVACGPTGPGNWGWDYDGSYGDWYGGHELGHTYGRLHPGFCGEDKDDLANYPFANGQLANSDSSFAGFDVGDPANNLPMRALPGTQWHDVMTYCDKQWLSAYTYLGIRRRLIEEDKLPSSASHGLIAAAPSSVALAAAAGRPDQRFPQGIALKPKAIDQPATVMVSVVGSVNLTKNQGQIRYVNPLSQTLPSPVEPNSATRLRIKSADGKVLDEYPVPVQLNSELHRGDDREGTVATVIPVSVSAGSIELIVGGQQVVDTFIIGSSAAKITDGPESSTSKQGLTYFAQISADSGQSWQTVAIGLKEPAFRLDQHSFAKGETIQVRIIGTDGLTNSVISQESVQM